MKSPFAPVLLAAVLAQGLLAQAPYPVGTRDLSLTNTTGQGSASIAVRMHYPAATSGSNVPVLAQQGGWPVVVFLHGFSALGNNYVLLCRDIAAAGYVVVAHNTMQFDNQGQEYDGRAQYPALVALNADGASPFNGALDMSRAGMVGHSMGGGNVGNVLANNPGFRCGVGLAPVPPRGNNAALVQVPMAVVTGTGDTITPLASNGQPYYDSLSAWRGVKALYVLNNECNHTNVCGYALFGTASSNPSYERAKSVTLGMFDWVLRGNPQGLDQVVGPPARSETRLVSLTHQWQVPTVWPAGALRPGTTTRVSFGSEPGACGGIAAAGMGAGPTPTPFGDLLLDGPSAFVAFSGFAGAEKRYDGSVAVPADPGLVGVVLPVQAYGTVGGDIRLGTVAQLRVVN
ncbi:MAG: hypothetical protein RL148_768 [Planctomycetota bacterium]